MYITVNKKFDNRIRIAYSRVEEPATVERIRHPLVREVLKLVGIEGGIEIMSIADIPAKGTGLGSSSSYTVGLLHALYAYHGQFASAERLAREACQIEIERCGEPIGKQDQYAAAFGGFNFIEFHPDDSVSVEPVICQRKTLLRLQANMMVFYTGKTRSASALLKAQQQTVAARKTKQTVLRRMVELARRLRVELQEDNLDALGEIIHENWVLKRSLSDSISNRAIDDWYSRPARQARQGENFWGQEVEDS